MIAVKSSNLPVRIKNKYKTKSYTKVTVLRALCMYSKWHYERMSPAPVSQLFKARIYHGTQFLMDMFILTEAYIDHWPQFAMHKARTDILYVLNQCPNFRLLYEDN